MKKINLGNFILMFIQQTFFVDVTEEVMETIRAAERAEAAYERKMILSSTPASVSNDTQVCLVSCGRC